MDTLDVNQLNFQYIEIIDYSKINIDASHQCKCGFVLFDAHIMSAWTDNIELPFIFCPICKEYQFIPQLKYVIARVCFFFFF